MTDDVNHVTTETDEKLKAQAMPILFIGIVLTIMELFKQSYLYLIYFGGRYEVWYFPFQLCSLPIYLTMLYGITLISADKHMLRLRPVILTFLRDFGLLGGVAALLVHDGFTYPGHPILTLHGYLWHILLISLSIYIYAAGMANNTKKSFLPEIALFGICAFIAELINVILHPYGDCDMFYISPYHPSSQVVFSSIDRVIGRPAGILLYLIVVCFGAYIVHLIYKAFSEHPSLCLFKNCK